MNKDTFLISFQLAQTINVKVKTCYLFLMLDLFGLFLSVDLNVITLFDLLK